MLHNSAAAYVVIAVWFLLIVGGMARAMFKN